MAIYFQYSLLYIVSAHWDAVFYIIFIILLSLIAYLFHIDRRVRQVEKRKH